jgi:hypothetical protein
MRPIIKSAVILAIAIVCLNLSLLVYGYLSAGPDHVFGGINYSPLDGNTYLAKMQQGYDGAWRFTLPYECETGEGAYVYLYYLFLGHVSGWLGLTCLFVYHFSRLVNGIIFILVLAVFISKVIPDQTWARRALWLSGLGSGMGWLALPFNVVTADMWLAEAYPFLSILANPHFPLGMAIALGIFVLVISQENWRNTLLVSGLCLLLSVVQQFLLVIVLILLFVITGYRIILKKDRRIKFLVLGVIGGLPYLVYQFWALTSDPILSQWTVQNLTPAPVIWNLILSLSPVIIVAAFAIIQYQRLVSDHKFMVVIWFLVSLILAYLPFALQRRFLVGIYIVSSLLAVLVILVISKNPSTQSRIYRIILCLSLPGAAIILLVMASGIISRAPSLYLTKSENNALNWLANNSPKGSLVIASPELGNFIPARSGNCVIYGHEFESINSEERSSALISFYSGEDNTLLMDQIPDNVNIIYLLYGPRERKLGSPDLLQDLPVAYSSDDVIVYEFPQD